jgi:acyl-CoA dehydrogenase
VGARVLHGDEESTKKQEKRARSVDFTIPEDLTRMQARIKDFVEGDLIPMSEEVEEEGHIPEGIVKKMRDLGLFGLAIPKEYGGLGLGTLGECLVYEELSRANACFRTRIGTNNSIGSQGIVIDGLEEQKRRYLPKLASGDWVACFALTEPEAGSDAANIQTRAELQGDRWVLNGVKHFITNGDIADLATVIALTDPEKRTRGGITAFLVEKTFPGFSLGSVENKMGLRGSHTCELVFDDCKVPRKNVIGGDAKIGLGFKTAMKVLDKGRLTMGAVAVGAAQRLLEICLDYAKGPLQLSPSLTDSQAIQFMLADMATQIYAARQMLHHAAWLRDERGTSVIKEASMAKLFCTEMAHRVVDMAMQIHGWMGYMKRCPVERFDRDLRLTRIYEGTSEIQRLIIARKLLKN